MLKSGFMLAAILATSCFDEAHAHGRLWEPISRMTAFRKIPGMPGYYNDHEMNCGGRQVQYNLNGGKCSICGEPYNDQKRYTRPNGTLVQHNIIPTVYEENANVTFNLEITVGHKGYHMFLLCDVAKVDGVEADQECLDKTPLPNENGETKFYYGTESPGWYTYKLVLPKKVTCKHCVIQWRWHCGNDWGCGKDGCCLGCGPIQEEFYACSDITIVPRSGVFPTEPTIASTSRRTTTTPSTTTTTTTAKSTSTSTTTKPTTTSPTTRYMSTKALKTSTSTPANPNSSETDTTPDDNSNSKIKNVLKDLLHQYSNKTNPNSIKFQPIRG